MNEEDDDQSFIDKGGIAGYLNRNYQNKTIGKEATPYVKSALKGLGESYQDTMWKARRGMLGPHSFLGAHAIDTLGKIIPDIPVDKGISHGLHNWLGIDKPLANVGGHIGEFALTRKVLKSIPNLVSTKVTPYTKGLNPVEVKKPPINVTPKNSAHLINKLDNYLPSPIQTAQRRMGMKFGEFGVLGKNLKGEIKPKRTKGKLTTPERIKGRIERGAPVYKDQPVPDIEDLSHAAKGPGFEKTWKRYDRSSVEGFSKELETHLQNKFGGSDSQMEAFKFVQTSAKKQAKILKDEMNKKSQFDFLSFALTATDPDVPKSKRLDIEDIHTLAQVMSDKPRSANLYDRGHNISAKNIARHEKQPTTSDYASNIDPAEIKGSIRDFIPTTKGIDTLRIKEVGNIKKGSRKDLPQPIQTLKGVSRNIEEEYVRFLNPEIDQAILRIPQEAWGEMLKYIRDGFDVKRSAGFSSFQDYLDDRGITRSQYDSFTKKSQNKLTAKFNKQKEFVVGKQQIDQHSKWIRELADDYLQKYTYEVETGIKKINPQLQYLEKYFPLDE